MSPPGMSVSRGTVMGMQTRGIVIGAGGTLAVLGLAFGLAGGASAAPPAPGTVYVSAPIAAEKVAAPAPAVSAGEAAFLLTIRGLLAGKPGDAQSDATLIAGGKSICADIDAGATSETFKGMVKEYDLNRAVYRLILSTSITAFCPAHTGVTI